MCKNETDVNRPSSEPFLDSKKLLRNLVELILAAPVSSATCVGYREVITAVPLVLETGFLAAM